MKKIYNIGVLNIVQILLIIVLALSIIFFAVYNLNLNFLAITISAISLALTILNMINKSIEGRRSTEIKRIPSRVGDINLLNDIEKDIKELKSAKKIIDSVHLIDACGYTDHRKEVIMIYH